MPCRFASSGTVATSRSASRAILALNVASNFLRDLVISVLHRLRQSRTLHTLTFGPISGVHFIHLAPPTSDHYANDISNVPPSLYFENNNLKATLQKLESVLDGSGIDDHAYAETLGLLLLWELRHAADPKHWQLKPVRGGLAGHQLRRIKEFLDVHISKEIGISELASLVGLSQFHFIRAFKCSVGRSPYQYVLSERISAAKEMLSKSDLSIADVALAVGFSDASQLNRVFRKLIGVTPTAFRRENGLRS